jgi:hypothetical protein
MYLNLEDEKVEKYKLARIIFIEKDRSILTGMEHFENKRMWMGLCR